MFRVGKAGVIILGVIVIDKYDCVLQPSDWWTGFSTRAVSEIWIREVANEGRNLWSHPVLLRKGAVWMALRDESLEQRPIKVIAVSLFHGQFVTFGLWSQLPTDRDPGVSESSPSRRQWNENTLVISNEDQLLGIVT